MKQVVVVKLEPVDADRDAMRRTLHAANTFANEVSRIAYRNRSRKSGRVESFQGLQRRCYQDLKAAGFGAQAALHVIKKTRAAYAAVYGQVECGMLRGKRARAAMSKPVEFRPGGAQPFDDRCLSWDLEARTDSIWTLEGRRKNIPFACSRADLKVLVDHRQGESDLLERDGALYLAATIEIPEETEYEPVDFIGVDRGIVNLATTSDEINYQGKGLERYRRSQARVRAELQAKATKSAKRKLKRRSGRESRHAANENHRISKEIVSAAKRTGRGIGLEDLEGLRDRVRLHASQRGRISNWPFHQLAQFIAYKAKRAGVPVVVVDARHTSQQCPLCHHTERANRRTRDEFECRGCGLAGPADVIAAVNVRARSRMAWAVSQRS